MKSNLRVLMCLLPVLLFGCAAVTPTSLSLASADKESETKRFLSIPDKAVLYIYRDQFSGSAWQIPIAINRIFIGKTGGYTFFRKTLAPGHYVVESKSENIAQISLVLEAGKVYYVRQETKMGAVKIRTDLKLVDEATGREGVKKSRLLQDFLTPTAHALNGKFGEVGEWKISGTEGQCQAFKQLEPSSPSQFAIGISRKGTYLTLQNLRWSLPSTPTNMMPVKVSFDGSVALQTEALLIGQVRAFQVFVWLTKMPDEVFWKRFLSARSMSVTGKFKPGRADVELKDTAEIVPLLRDCAQQYLPGIKLPFKESQPSEDE